MYSPLSRFFLDALKTSYTMYPRLEAKLGSVVLDRDIPVSGGDVQVTSGDGVHRTLNVTIPEISYWKLFEPIGVELYPFWVMRYMDGSTEEIPLGVFGVESENLGAGFDGSIAISSAPDRFSRVRRARFEKPRQSQRTPGTSREARNQIQRLMQEAISTPTVITTTSAYNPTALLIWDRDRAQAIIDLAAAGSMEAFYDPRGRAIIRDLPKLSGPIVWEVDAVEGGSFVSGARTRTQQQTYNVVVVYSTAPDGLGFPTQIVADDDPTSPTWVGSPMGRVPYFFPNSIMANGAAARLAGITRLNKVKSKLSQLSLTSVVNPALTEGDVISVKFPDGTTERHIVESFNVPLTVDGGDQTIGTRSSRPTGDVPDSE